MSVSGGYQLIFTI